MIKIISWWRISHGKMSPTFTDLNNNIVTNPNPNKWWLIVGGKSVAAIGLIPYTYNAKVNQSSLVSVQSKYHSN